MEPAKKIEPGCLALILYIHPTKVWESPTIPNPIKVLGEIEPYQGERVWSVDYIKPHGPFKGRHACFTELGLMRIDDPDLQREIEQERELAHG